MKFVKPPPTINRDSDTSCSLSTTASMGFMINTARQPVEMPNIPLNMTYITVNSTCTQFHIKRTNSAQLKQQQSSSQTLIREIISILLLSRSA